MNTTHSKTRRSIVRPGTAMTETMLALPFIMLILLLVFYFGRGANWVQHATVMPRFEADRRALAQGVPYTRQGGGLSHSLLNEVFFSNTAQSISVTDNDNYPGGAMNDLRTAEQARSEDAGILAQTLAGYFPSNLSMSVVTSHASTIPLWNLWDRPVHTGFLRPGSDWQFAPHWNDWMQNWSRRSAGNGWLLHNAHDAFMTSLDETLADTISQGNTLARNVRDYYWRRPGYRGPIF